MTVSQDKPKVYLSPDEVAAMLGISRQTIYNWISKKIAPPYTKVNNLVRFEAHELYKWLDERAVNPEDVS